jgi:hypothetical protein
MGEDRHSGDNEGVAAGRLPTIWTALLSGTGVAVATRDRSVLEWGEEASREENRSRRGREKAK